MTTEPPDAMPDMMDLFEQTIEDLTAAGPTDNEIRSISGLAREQVRLQKKVADDTAALAATQAELDTLRKKTLPDALRAAGVIGYETEDGLVSIVDEVYASISEKNAPEAFRWLEEHNHSSIIKEQIKLSFGKGEQDKASDLKATLIEKGLAFDVNRGVHASTLKAFVKEQLAKGSNIPATTFGIHQEKVTRITPTKGK
jgi:hypothetical protein